MLCLITACNQRSGKSISFYYWKTIFSLNSLEKETLEHNSVNTLYVRYFDVDFAPGDNQPKPVSPVLLDTSIHNYHIVPVVYIKNRTFERLDTAGVAAITQKILNLVSQVSRSANITTNEIQFDCDWTESTKEKYFLFITHYRSLSKNIISSTIRLHQVKYLRRTGVPPVDRGVLMYYNIGDINSGNYNSIYEKLIADKYSGFIRSYPLTLDIALPVFSWGLKINDGKVVQLMNKINFSHLQNDSNFIQVNKNRFIVKHACFKAGYYFREEDEVKIEHIPGKSLLEMAEQINRYSGAKTGNLIFYDLDSSNLIRYDKNIFKKILDIAG